MSAPQERDTKMKRLFTWYVDVADRHNGKLLAALLGLMFVSAFFASRLELHTDFAELLPPTHPAVVAYHGISGRQRSATNLVMLIHSPNAEANFRLAETLRPRLQALVPKTFTQIQWSKDKEMPEFFRQQKWLYAETKDLENAEALLDRIIARRAQPGFVDLEGDPEEELK